MTGIDVERLKMNLPLALSVLIGAASVTWYVADQFADLRIFIATHVATRDDLEQLEGRVRILEIDHAREGANE
jgi:hypothetical protein